MYPTATPVPPNFIPLGATIANVIPQGNGVFVLVGHTQVPAEKLAPRPPVASRIVVDLCAGADAISLPVRCWIYVLLLEDGFFYVGKTKKDVTTRFKEHRCGSCAWTRLHKPVEVVTSFRAMDKFHEDTTTKQYMAQYGIDRVRGGCYSQQVLGVDQIHFLRKELRSAEDLCFRCGGKGHVESSCLQPPPPATALPRERWEDEDEEDYVLCFKCGRRGHYSPECREEVFCFRCGRHGHSFRSCFARTIMGGGRRRCFRCGLSVTPDQM